MATYTFDSSVISAYKVRELRKDFVLSAVVVAELTAGAPDNATRKDYEALRRDYFRNGALLVPSGRIASRPQGRHRTLAHHRRFL
jgi:hypothetical protein